MSAKQNVPNDIGKSSYTRNPAEVRNNWNEQFPETDSLDGLEADSGGAASFIGSSEAAGAGHLQWGYRHNGMNDSWPNTESGEGQDNVCDQEGSSVGTEFGDSDAY